LAITARIVVQRIDQKARILRHNDPHILDQICSVLESSKDLMRRRFHAFRSVRGCAALQCDLARR